MIEFMAPMILLYVKFAKTKEQKNVEIENVELFDK